MTYPFTLTLQSRSDVTHDTRHFRFDRPDGFEFEAGQATHMALNQDGWREEDRPFTMASQPETRDHLDFIIKIYPDHDGVTKRLDDLTPGDTILAEAPAGAITDHGPGTFLAAGAGITPFIPILDAHDKSDRMDRCRLIYSNKAERDIILRARWERMQGLDTVFVTDDKADALPDAPVDADMLDLLIDRARPVYICGPQGFVDAMRDSALDIGVPKDKLVIENGW